MNNKKASVRTVVAKTGDTVPLLQRIKGALVCLKRVNVHGCEPVRLMTAFETQLTMYR